MYSFLNIIFGSLSIIFISWAYIQTDRIRFLKINTLNALFFGASLLLNGGVSGALVSFINAGIFVAALFVKNDGLRVRMSCAVPLIAFAIALQAFDNVIIHPVYPVVLQKYSVGIPAMATFFVTLAALQKDMLVNKTFLLASTALWALYGLLVTAWFAFVSDIVGLIIIVISIYKLLKKEPRQIRTELTD